MQWQSPVPTSAGWPVMRQTSLRALADGHFHDRLRRGRGTMGWPRHFEILHGVRQRVRAMLWVIFYDLAAKGLLRFYLSIGGCRQISDAPSARSD